MKYYIADCHIFHKNITKEGTNLDNRPFDTMESMIDEFILGWKGILSNDDVYLVGDIFWKEGDRAVDLLSSLPGRKHLIRGNHDRCKNQEYTALFEDIHPYLEIKGGERRVILCHYPILFWNAMHRGSILLYGHVHNTIEENIFQRTLRGLDFEASAYNVGCMMPYMGWRPQTLGSIITKGDEYYSRIY